MMNYSLRICMHLAYMLSLGMRIQMLGVCVLFARM